MTALEIPLETMPLSERLALLNRIRETLPPLTPQDESKDFDMPEWHTEVLEERLKKAEGGQAKWYTIEEVEERRAHREQ